MLCSHEPFRISAENRRELNLKIPKIKKHYTQPSCTPVGTPSPKMTPKFLTNALRILNNQKTKSQLTGICIIVPLLSLGYA